MTDLPPAALAWIDQMRAELKTLAQLVDEHRGACVVIHHCSGAAVKQSLEAMSRPRVEALLWLAVGELARLGYAAGGSLERDRLMHGAGYPATGSDVGDVRLLINELDAAMARLLAALDPTGHRLADALREQTQPPEE